MAAYGAGIDAALYDYELPFATDERIHVANSNAVVFSVLNQVGVDARQLGDVGSGGVYDAGFPGASPPDGLYASIPTLLGSASGSDPARIVAHQNLTAGVAILGRDTVDDFMIGTRFGDAFYGEQEAASDATSDTVSYERSTAAVTVVLEEDGSGTGSGGDAAGDTYLGIENITGSDFGDTLEGSGDDNSLFGGEGFDQLDGSTGDDLVIGGEGEDTLYSGDGDDRLDGGAGDDFLVATGEGVTTFVFGRGYGHDAILNTPDVLNPAMIGHHWPPVGEREPHGEELYSDDEVIFHDLLPSDIELAIDRDYYHFHINAGEHGAANLVVRVTETDDTLFIPFQFYGENGFGMAPMTSNITTFRFADDTVWDAEQIVDEIDIYYGYDLPPAWWGRFQYLGDQFDGTAGADDLAGTQGRDGFEPSAGSDRVHASGGNDQISGDADAADDYFDGGAGQDEINYADVVVDLTVNLATGTATSSEIGSDTLVSIEIVEGGAGNDTLRGHGGTNRLVGAAGNDLLKGQDGNDILVGGVGDDTLDGGNGDDRHVGGAGDDRLISTAGLDWFDGGDGVDEFDASASTASWTIYLATGAATFGTTTETLLNVERVVMGSGADTVSGAGGAERLEGGAGNDTLKGNAGNDELYGGVGNDYLHGGDGDDLHIGGDGDDRLVSTAGTDSFDGGVGVDTFDATASNVSWTIDLAAGTGTFGSTSESLIDIETVLMGNGADHVYGNAAANLLEGGGGNDVLTGFGGADTLTGGTGADTFRFTQIAGSVDRITDLGASDRAELHGILTGYSSGQASAFISVRNSGADLMLALDANGAAGGTAFVDLALFDGLAGSTLSGLLGSGQLMVS